MAEDLITESERYAAALKEGAKRLLMEHELPDGWKNNSYIRSGYRFIPIERWQELMGTLFTWHNETGERACSSEFEDISRMLTVST